MFLRPSSTRLETDFGFPLGSRSVLHLFLTVEICDTCDPCVSLTVIRSGFPPMLDFLTPAAVRAWEQARLLARDGQAREVEPLHLMWALVLDESRASQTLQELGITAETLQKSHPVEPPLPEDLAWEIAEDEQDGDRSADADAAGELPTADLPLAGESMHDVFREARHQAGPFSGAIEVGTEHLLQGLALVDSPVSRLLAQRGFVPVLEIPRRGAESSTVAGSGGMPSETERLVADEPLVMGRVRVTDETDGLRIVDAAANRAREGLRVLEDFVRFARDNRLLTAELKTWRHEFSRLLNHFGERGMLASRDTDADVGTSVRTRHETTRDALLDVVRAAFKRTQEATRTLEEVSKTLLPDVAEPLGQLRYRLYTLEKAVLTAESASERLAGRPVYLLLTEALCHHGSGPAVKEALAGGVGIVQIREKSTGDRALLEHARRVRAWTAQVGALLILNDRPDLAVLAEADGVHLGQDDLTVREARRIVGPDRIVGVSTHSLDQARRAVLDGADYIGVGPVFPSTTKSFAEFVGLELVRQIASEISLPWYAIGGIGADRIGAVVQAGPRGSLSRPRSALPRIPARRPDISAPSSTEGQLGRLARLTRTPHRRERFREQSPRFLLVSAVARRRVPSQPLRHCRPPPTLCFRLWEKSGPFGVAPRKRLAKCSNVSDGSRTQPTRAKAISSCSRRVAKWSRDVEPASHSDRTIGHATRVVSHARKASDTTSPGTVWKNARTQYIAPAQPSRAASQRAFRNNHCIASHSPIHQRVVEGCDRPDGGVLSITTQPSPGNHASAQACASLRRAIQFPPRGLNSSQR